MKNVTVAEYLFSRLAELGITDVFGVPGDFNFNVVTAVEASQDVRWIGCSNELNAGYAADGYARVKGFGAVVTTFGVGELSAMNAIGGSYCEHVPVFHIVGSPAMSVQNSHRIIHHTLGNGDYEVFKRMSEGIVAGHTMLSADNAASEIERLIGIATTQRRPVYISLPTDVCLQPIAERVPRFSPPSPDLLMLREAVSETAALIKKAKRPVLIGDGKVARFGLEKAFVALAEKADLPMTTLFMGKGIVDETHPNFIGTYCGAMIDPEARTIVEAADLVIAVGTILGDTNSASYSITIDRAKTIDIQEDHIMVKRARYDDVTMKDVLAALTEAVEPHPGKIPQTVATYGAPESQSGQPVNGDNMYQHLQAFVQGGDIIVSETGTISFGAVEFRLPAGATFTCQALWMSIGWATPAAFGAAIAAPDRRVILLTGDGSHQLTAQEIGSMIRYGCNPVVFLLNNQGYTIERYLCDNMDDPFNDVASWNYHKLPEALGGKDCYAAKVSTTEELAAALKAARAADTALSYIECVTFPHDAPKMFRAVRANRAALYNAPGPEADSKGRPVTPQRVAACPG